MDILDVIRPELCVCSLQAKDRDDALKQLADLLLEKGYVKEGYYESVLAREGQYPTGIELEEYNIALPHTFADFVNNAAFVVAGLDTPVKFACMDDDEMFIDVNVIIMMAIKEKTQQVEALRQLMKLVVRNSEAIGSIKNATSGEEIYSILKSCVI